MCMKEATWISCFNIFLILLAFTAEFTRDGAESKEIRTARYSRVDRLQGTSGSDFSQEMGCAELCVLEGCAEEFYFIEVNERWFCARNADPTSLTAGAWDLYRRNDLPPRNVTEPPSVCGPTDDLIHFVHREDGSLDFDRDWIDYKTGFSDANSPEFWLGLEELHRLTTSSAMGLYVTLTDWQGNRLCARYSSFTVGSEGENYNLLVSGYDEDVSTAGDSMAYHNNNNFSTIDVDNDAHDRPFTCAIWLRGGWWYNDCHETVPTANYVTDGQIEIAGVVWRTAYDNWYSFKQMTLSLIPP